MSDKCRHCEDDTFACEQPDSTCHWMCMARSLLSDPWGGGVADDTIQYGARALRREREAGLRDGAAQERERIEAAFVLTPKLPTNEEGERAVDAIVARSTKPATTKRSLSPRAIAERTPPPPADRVGALHDVVHKDVGVSRAAKTQKIATESTAVCEACGGEGWLSGPIEWPASHKCDDCGGTGAGRA